MKKTELQNHIDNISYPQYHLPRPNLDPERLLDNFFHLQYSKVVNIGNSRPYQFSSLLGAPKDFSYHDYRTEYKTKLYEMLLNDTLGLFPLIKMVVKHYVLDLVISLLAGIVEVLIPLSVMWFLEWYQKEADFRRKVIRNEMIWEGLGKVCFMGFLVFVGGILKARAEEASEKVKLAVVNTLRVS